MTKIARVAFVSIVLAGSTNATAIYAAAEEPAIAIAAADAAAADAAAAVVLAAIADAHPGATIYRSKCVACHGETGQGVAEKYDESLFGDHSVEVLAQLIDETMPGDDPTKCVGDEARQVAAYIHQEFYSLAARQRKGLVPLPRIDLTRLTVAQYQNVVADVIGRFTPEPRKPNEGRRRRRSREKSNKDQDGKDQQEVDTNKDKDNVNENDKVASPDIGESGDTTTTSDNHGLQGEYYQSDGMSKADEQRLLRVDGRIDFDFGEGSPNDNITADQFAIIWQGSLVSHDTGYHEFRVSSPNGARLYVNNDEPEGRGKLRDDSSVAGQAALIDGWVSSGKMREHTARVFLLGGRQYPLRLEFFKYKEKNASIKLEWKPPQGTWSTIDGRFLRTDRTSRTYVVDTPFPADDRSLGYERGNSISREWYAATSNAAIAAANEVVSRLPLLAGVEENAEDYTERLQEFVTRFATVAFRRPLTDAETELLRTAPFDGAPNADTAVRRALLLVFDSPHFLYPDLTLPGEAPSQHTVASRLALAIWDSIPDEPLLDAANKGELSDVAQLTEQVRRMLADPRAKAKMQGFFRHWLEIEERDLSKDKEQFPDFDESVISDLRYSLETFVEDTVWSKASDYRQLLLADYLVLNDRLRQLYQSPDEFVDQSVREVHEPTDDSTDDSTDGANADDGPSNDDATSDDASRDEASSDHVTDVAKPIADGNATFETVHCDANRRAGVLTHPYLLSAFAYHNNTSPIHRGVFLTRNIVGRELKPPPIAVAFKNDEFDPDLTMREKITQLTRDSACISCHSVINPLGFALENFDAVGRWRTSDNNKPVDAESQYTTPEGEVVRIQNARDVANFAVASEAAHRAFVAQLFQHLVKQDPAAYGADNLDQLRKEFANDDYNVQNLVLRIAVRTSLHGIALPPNAESIEASPES